jgi:type IV pilus biogenesis protein CpaD/CtpE
MTGTGRLAGLRRRLAARRSPLAMAAALLIACWVAGCAHTDPYTRPGVWIPTGVNAANLRAMVAVPSDLVAGHGDTRGNADIAAMALDRFRRDAVRPLPDTTVSTVGAAAASNSGGSGGGAGGGGAPAAAPAADNGGT